MHGVVFGVGIRNGRGASIGTVLNPHFVCIYLCLITHKLNLLSHERSRWAGENSTVQMAVKEGWEGKRIAYACSSVNVTGEFMNRMRGEGATPAFLAGIQRMSVVGVETTILVYHRSL